LTGSFSTSSRNHVLSPVAQTLYKFPGNSGRQLRLAFTRTYKAPTVDQLTARRYESAVNTRFAPTPAATRTCVRSWPTASTSPTSTS
jgi:outer membrane receptor for ferrienterochelin and colicins